MWSMTGVCVHIYSICCTVFYTYLQVYRKKQWNSWAVFFISNIFHLMRRWSCDSWEKNHSLCVLSACWRGCVRLRWDSSRERNVYRLTLISLSSLRRKEKKLQVRVPTPSERESLEPSCRLEPLTFLTRAMCFIFVLFSSFSRRMNWRIFIIYLLLLFFFFFLIRGEHGAAVGGFFWDQLCRTVQSYNETFSPGKTHTHTYRFTGFLCFCIYPTCTLNKMKQSM